MMASPSMLQLTGRRRANRSSSTKVSLSVPEFTFNYKDNEELKDHGPTLLGAALTNRPVIKNGPSS